MHDSEIQEIISACRSFAAIRDVILPPIVIDRSKIARTLSENAVAVLTNTASNMAAKVIAHANQISPPHWDPGKVICISDVIVNAKPDSMQAIGVIVHEMGHAFNIAAGTPNTEANAQVFEIEMLLHFLDQNKDKDKDKNKNKDKHTDAIKPEALDAFFSRRIPQYLANDPASSGYVPLHTAIRNLPASFSSTHAEYNHGIGSHFSTHKRRGSLKFFAAMEELELLSKRGRTSGDSSSSDPEADLEAEAETELRIDPTKTYPLIKLTEKLPLFFPAKASTGNSGTSLSVSGYSPLRPSE